MLRNIWLVTLVSAFSFAGVAGAEGIVEKAERAQSQIEAGDPSGALNTLNEAVSIAWEAIPLTIPTALFVDSFSGYGLYVERADGSLFRKGEQLVLYAEILGYGYGNTGTGSLAIGFDIDLALQTPAGEVIFAREKLASVMTPVRYENREFFMNLDLNLSDLAAGEYVMALVIRDQNSDKSAPLQLSFSITE